VRLSDVMSQLDLTIYPRIGLVLFLGVFAGVLLRVCGRGGRGLSAHAGMALDDGDPSGQGGSHER
jgi:hypothetical protein